MMHISWLVSSYPGQGPEVWSGCVQGPHTLLRQLMCTCGHRSAKEDEPPKAIVLAERVVASAVHSMQLDNAVGSLPCTVSCYGPASAAHCNAWHRFAGVLRQPVMLRLRPSLMLQGSAVHDGSPPALLAYDTT